MIKSQNLKEQQRKEDFGAHDHPRPEGMWHVKEKVVFILRRSRVNSLTFNLSIQSKLY